MLIPERKDCETVLRALQRKRLNGWIDESDGEDFCVFYGKVKLKVIEKEKIAMTQKRLINITCYKYIPKIKKANGNSEQVYIEVICEI